jgi:hypothetical protein
MDEIEHCLLKVRAEDDSAFIDGQRIYYDYMRPHSALNGKTPAEVAGIELELGSDKWESLIKKEAQSSQAHPTT